MVGQSFDVAVLALIEAPSTAEVTALMCSGDPLRVCASALRQESARPSPIASSGPAQVAPVDHVRGCCGKQTASRINARQTCHLVPPNANSSGSKLDGMLARTMASIKARDAKRKRENSSRHFFAKRNAKWHARRAATSHCSDVEARMHSICAHLYGAFCACPNSTGRSACVLQSQSPLGDFLNANDFSILIR